MGSCLGGTNKTRQKTDCRHVEVKGMGFGRWAGFFVYVCLFLKFNALLHLGHPYLVIHKS